MSMRDYTEGGILIDSEGNRWEIITCRPNYVWGRLDNENEKIMRSIAGCMEYEPPPPDEWLATANRGEKKDAYERILQGLHGRPSEWVKKKDVATAIWLGTEELNYTSAETRLRKIGITRETSKQ